MNFDRQPKDQSQRRLALDPQQSFICEAPAGSGKTELLTQRVLTLLARVDQPEAVLAITFTRKAAAEMRERILLALHKGTREKPVEAHAQTTWHLAQAALLRDRELGWSLLENPNRLQIRTFDSLCALLTQALPLHSSLGVNVAITDDSDALYLEAVAQILATLEQDVPWVESLKFLLRHLDNQFYRVEELLVSMLKSRDAWMPVVNATISGDEVRNRLEAHLQHVVEDQVARLQEILTLEFAQPLLHLADFAAANVLRMNIESPISQLISADALYEWPDASAAGQAKWRALTQLLLTRDGEWRKRLDKNGGFPPGEDKHEKIAFKQRKEAMQALLLRLAEQPDLLDALRDIAYWPSTTYRQAQWQVLQALTQVLPVLVAHLQLAFRAHGEVDFLEMSTRARQALGDEGEPTDLALRLDYAIAHILVDEFQDTSFSQVELIHKLTAGWQPGDGRTLFCVGDAMQSIYGFRGANVGLFLHCRDHGLGNIPLTPLQLTTNFRSQAGLVQWSNASFAQAFPARHDISSGAVAFARADDFRPELEGAAVETHVYESIEREHEGRLVVDLIHQSRAQMADGTIAILARNRSHVQAIIPALKQAGMRFRAVDLEPLGEQDAIVDLVTLTQALLYPADRIAWLSLLRGPWCGLTLGELERITSRLEGDAETLVFDQMPSVMLPNESAGDEIFDGSIPLSASGQQRLQRLYAVLALALQERQRKPLQQWIEGVWLQLGGAACLQSQEELGNVERYLNLLEGLSDKGELPNKETLQAYLQDLYAAPDPEADDRLQIMTIHKSKGLEFDTVILPGLHRQPRGSDSELLLWQERLTSQGQDEWLLAPISPVGEEKDPIYKHLEHQKKKRERFESCRLLYVACTRAKQRLHLLAEVIRADDASETRFKTPRTGSLLSTIWRSVELSAQAFLGDRARTRDGEKIAAASSEWVTRPIRRLPAHWRLPDLPEVTLLDRFVPPYEFVNDWVNTDWQHHCSAEAPRHVGTLVHHVLQTIGEQGTERWLQRDLSLCEGPWLSRLVHLGVAPAQAQLLLPQVVRCVHNALNNSAFIELLKSDCQFEVALSSVNAEGEFQQNVIDVLRVDGNAALVVDYKTSFPEPGQDPLQFIQDETERYRTVMQHYGDLVRGLGFTEVQSALFFPALGHWQVL